METNAGEEREVELHCPQAAVVLELCHVAKHGHVAIDRMRVDCANALRADKTAHRVGERSPGCC
jgi:transposase